MIGPLRARTVEQVIAYAPAHMGEADVLRAGLREALGLLAQIFRAADPSIFALEGGDSAAVDWDEVTRKILDRLSVADGYDVVRLDCGMGKKRREEGGPCLAQIDDEDCSLCSAWHKERERDCGLTSADRHAKTQCRTADKFYSEDCAECRIEKIEYEKTARVLELEQKNDELRGEIADLRSGAKLSAAQLEAALVELATKTKALEFVTAERDRLLLEAQQAEKKPASVRRPRPSPVDPAQVNLFELVRMATESRAAPDAKPPAKRRGRPPKKAAPAPSSAPAEDV